MKLKGGLRWLEEREGRGWGGRLRHVHMELKKAEVHVGRATD